MTPDDFLSGVIKDYEDRIAGLDGDSRMNYLMGLTDGINLASQGDIPPKIEAFLRRVQSAQGKAARDKMEDRSSLGES